MRPAVLTFNFKLQDHYVLPCSMQTYRTRVGGMGNYKEIGCLIILREWGIQQHVALIWASIEFCLQQCGRLSPLYV